MPNKWTFQIPPIADLLARYIEDGKGWVDPFAGMSRLTELTNDLNPNMPAKYHIDAEKFCLQLTGSYKGVLFDPPYSYRQVKECYEGIGLKPTTLDTSTNFYRRVMNAISAKIIPTGYAICCGWNSSGFGKKRGFQLIEILLVCHGQHHNDTIVTVEQKIQASFGIGDMP